MSFPFRIARHAPRVARIIGLLSLSLALAACSTVKLGYAALPDVAYWWLDGYVDLEGAQAQRVREDLQRLHAWHRANELPRAVAMLQRMEGLAAHDSITPTQACAFEPEIRARLLVLRDQAEPAIVTTALTLTPEQLKHLERKYARNNREFEKDWIRPSPAEQMDRRVKLVAERMEKLYGTVSEAQRAVIRKQLQATPFPAGEVLAQRKRHQQETLALLQRLTTQPVPLAEARTAVRGLMERFTDSPDPAWRAYQQAMVQDACRLVAAVHNTATPPQREHAVQRLRGWQRDLQELASAS